jgi:hypothetical protein
MTEPDETDDLWADRCCECGDRVTAHTEQGLQEAMGEHLATHGPQGKLLGQLTGWSADQLMGAAATLLYLENAVSADAAEAVGNLSSRIADALAARLDAGREAVAGGGKVTPETMQTGIAEAMLTTTPQANVARELARSWSGHRLAVVPIPYDSPAGRWGEANRCAVLLDRLAREYP